MPDLHVVTGAFGYTGRYIAEGLLARGFRVRTLTNATDRPEERETLGRTYQNDLAVRTGKGRA